MHSGFYVSLIASAEQRGEGILDYYLTQTLQ